MKVICFSIYFSCVVFICFSFRKWVFIEYNLILASKPSGKVEFVQGSYQLKQRIVFNFDNQIVPEI